LKAMESAMSKFFSTRTPDLVTYALIGAAATPIAFAAGQIAAAVFCVVAFIVVGASKPRA